jgi:hypothetical protein
MAFAIVSQEKAVIIRDWGHQRYTQSNAQDYRLLQILLPQRDGQVLAIGTREAHKVLQLLTFPTVDTSNKLMIRTGIKLPGITHKSKIVPAITNATRIGGQSQRRLLIAVIEGSAIRIVMVDPDQHPDQNPPQRTKAGIRLTDRLFQSRPVIPKLSIGTRPPIDDKELSEILSVERTSSDQSESRKIKHIASIASLPSPPKDSTMTDWQKLVALLEGAEDTEGMPETEPVLGRLKEEGDQTFGPRVTTEAFPLMEVRGNLVVLRDQLDDEGGPEKISGENHVRHESSDSMPLSGHEREHVLLKEQVTGRNVQPELDGRDLMQHTTLEDNQNVTSDITMNDWQSWRTIEEENVSSTSSSEQDGEYWSSEDAEDFPFLQDTIIELAQDVEDGKKQLIDEHQDRKIKEETDANIEAWASQSLARIVEDVLERFLMLLPEPPIPEGHLRARWTCVSLLWVCEILN